MIEVVSVRFKDKGKTYYFSPGDMQIPNNTTVIVETAKGLEMANCAYGNHYVADDRVVQPLKPVVRVATDGDLQMAQQNKSREKEAFQICQKKIADHGLDMKLVDVECNFEGNKIIFFFTSEGRVDFRELVKDLASVFRTRIELRQIGVRDEAKLLGGLGICGRPFCCHQFLDDFRPVSTKMAKIQSMSLNPTKISGTCGRLMCCLRYEQEAYEELIKSVPKNGSFVETTAGYGNVIQVNLLRRQVKVRLDGEGEDSVRTYSADEVAVIPGGRPQNGEPLPHLLEIVPKELEPEETEDPWKMPVLFAEDVLKAESPQKKTPEGGDAPVKKRRRSRGGKGHGGGKPAGEHPEAQNAKAEGDKTPKGERARTATTNQQGRSGRHSPRAQNQNGDVRQKSGDAAAAPKPPRPPRERSRQKPKPSQDGESPKKTVQENGQTPAQKKASGKSRWRRGKPKPQGESGASTGDKS